MFRTSCVHHQEDYVYMQFFMVCFSCSRYGHHCLPLFNTWCSKHVEDTKNWIETLILKTADFVGLHYIIVAQCMVQKT